MSDLHIEEPHSRQFPLLTLTSLVVVYGDIGTNPLFALREGFFGTHPFPPTPKNVLAILSLIFWSLVAIISCKYLLLVMKADNRGEGGIQPRSFASPLEVS